VEFEDLVERGYVEFIDAEEEEDILVAVDEEDVTDDHTHLEIDPQLVFGIGAGMIPYPSTTRAPDYDGRGDDEAVARTLPPTTASGRTRASTCCTTRSWRW